MAMRDTLRLLALASTLAAVAAGAQEARRPAGDGTARLQQQLQQLATERTALQAENADLKARLDKAEKAAKSLAGEKDALTRRAGAAESKVSRAEASQQSAGARLEATEARLNEVVTRYRELADQLRAVETERSALARQAAADAQGLKTCARNNVELADVALEALDRYKKKGCFGALAQAEPFTGLKRVQVQNAVDESRQRVEKLRLTPEPGSKPAEK